MAKGKKSGGKDFKPGVSGNENGRPPLDPAVKQFKKLTQDIIDEVGFLVLDGDKVGLAKIIADPQASTLKRWIAQVAETGIKLGDMDSLDKLLNRLLGKAPQKLEHSGTVTLEELVAGSRKE